MNILVFIEVAFLVASFYSIASGMISWKINLESPSLVFPIIL